MTRCWPLGLALAAVACAQVEAPPGGPEDRVGPRVIATRPDTLSRAAGFTGPATIVFDERVSEQGVEDAVSVSPRTSAARIDHSGDEIRVSLVRGWEPGRIYQIRVNPGLKDLFGNATTQPAELVFSTGPEIPDTRATGRVVSRTTGERLVNARVEAIRAADSLVYSVQTDSAGAFVFTRVPEGDYRLRAFSDANRNRALDPFEARDTARLRIAVRETAPPVLLRTLAPDTSAPRPGATESAGQVIRVTFDDFLEARQPVSPAQVRIVGPDSALVPVTEVRVGTFPPARAPAADSAARDSAALPATPRPGIRPDTGRAGAAAAAADTLPSRTLSIRVGRPLQPRAQYRVVITGVRNVNGLTGGGEATLRTPAPAPAPVVRDSAAGAGTPRPPAPQPGTPPGSPPVTPAPAARPPAPDTTTAPPRPRR